MTGVKEAKAGTIFLAACLERTFVDLPKFDFLDSPRAKARRQTLKSALTPETLLFRPLPRVSHRVSRNSEFRASPRPLQSLRQVASRRLPSKDESRLSFRHVSARFQERSPRSRARRRGVPAAAALESF